MARIHQKKFQKVRHQARLIVANVGVPLFLKAQNHTCPICQKKLNSTNLTIDHVWPLHQEILNAGNLLLCHYSCNQVKADRLPTQFEIEMLEQVNERLGFNLVTNRYQCRQLLVNRYYKLALWMDELLDRAADHKEINRVQKKIDALECQIGQWINK